MNAMLLAAGEGSRLRPLTLDRPKPMIAIAGAPILEHNVRLLAAHGVRRIVINVHHKPHVIMDYFGDGSRFGVEISYSLEERLLGTAGGIKQASAFLGEEFFVIYGDNLSTCNLNALRDLHERRRATLTMALYERDNPTASGIVGLDANDRVVRFLEKPRADQIFSNWVNAGYLVMNSAVLTHVADGAFSDFGHDVFEPLIAREAPVYGYRMSEKLWWIDNYDDYERTCRAFDDPGSARELALATLPTIERVRN